MIEIVDDAAGFAELAGEWDGLVRAMPRPSPFLLHGWLSTWWEHHGDGAQLRVLVARRDGRLEGALPLCVRRRGGVSVLRFLGEGDSALADVLLAPGADPALAARLGEAAAAVPHDLADLFGLPAGSRLEAALGARRLRLVPRAEAPVLELDDGWDAVYRAKYSSKTRNTHKRRQRQLAELGEVSVEMADDGAALEEAFRLHELRWRDRPEASGFATPAGRRFHHDALRALAPLGVPRIVLLRVGGRAIACNYFMLLEGRMYFHELAFDPELGRFSPGLVTTLEAIGAAAAAGARRVEFLGGQERYKLELADRLEPLYQGLGLQASWRGRAALHGRAAALAARRALKRTPVRELYYERMAPIRRIARRAGARSSNRGTSAVGRNRTRMQ
jgi:CelD/BcsL family acetyltransferase involved in cellulose biosynthesis